MIADGLTAFAVWFSEKHQPVLRIGWLSIVRAFTPSR